MVRIKSIPKEPVRKTEIRERLGGIYFKGKEEILIENFGSFVEKQAEALLKQTHLHLHHGFEINDFDRLGEEDDDFATGV